MNNLPPSTPLDVRRGVTDAEAVAHPLRWGILGAGSISAQWVESLRACKGASVTAVAAREMSRAQAFANALDIPNAYDSYTEMAAAKGFFCQARGPADALSVWFALIVRRAPIAMPPRLVRSVIVVGRGRGHAYPRVR